MPVNKVLDLDLSWINSVQISDTDITTKVATASYTDKATISKNTTVPWLIKAMNFVDLSSLTGNETPDAIAKLCHTAAFPLAQVAKPPKTLEGTKIQCAAVCVYPLRIKDSIEALSTSGADKNVLVAAVAAGFPTGQYPLHSRLAEIYYAVAVGAQEIDVVIDRSLVLRGLWSQLYDELVQMRNACNEATLKVILSVTECGSWTNVYKASVVAMLAGADFIKTSTGKEATTMTMHEGLVMCQAIKEFYSRTGIKVGLKPAGGVRTAEHSISWMLMIQQELGDEWVDPKLFRIGSSTASSLIGDLASVLLKM